MMTPSWVMALKLSSPQGYTTLILERKKSKIDKDRLAHFLYTEQNVEMQQRILEVLQNDQAFDKSGNYFRSRIEQYTTSLARAKRLHQLRTELCWTEEEFEWAVQAIGEPTAYSIHWQGFVPTLQDQGTPTQHEIFLQPAKRMDIIGAYAQTELGHGSNVRSLETTSTWNPNDCTFTLHSPSLTAAKWWAGTMGLTANYAIVMAKLIVNGKDHGPHPFVCQIRDLTTHEPLEGIYVGDIGPKMGYNTVDNGFLLLNQVKVPHVNMLARYSRVDPDRSIYIEPESPALIYGTLTMLRSALVSQSARNLARGVTIATRYCAVRRQSSDPDSVARTIEMQVIDYTMVQFRLFPLIGETFALHFMGQAMMALYHEARAALSSGISASSRAKDMFSELHAISCGLKALATSSAVTGLEVCRRACGGHGYSSFTGIGNVYADYLPSQTFEGDNYLLTQQLAGYLLKTARLVSKHTLGSNKTVDNLTKYAMNRAKTMSFDLHCDQDIVDAFGWRAAYMTFKVLHDRDNARKPWNDLLVDFFRLSTAHSQFLMVSQFHEHLKSSNTVQQLDTESLSNLSKLYRLYALTTILSTAYEFCVSSTLTLKQVEGVEREMIPSLLRGIRPHAVKLMDAWKIPDWLLDSSLGRYDGYVYEDMFYRATQLNPLNHLAPVNPRPDNSVAFTKERAKKATSHL